MVTKQEVKKSLLNGVLLSSFSSGPLYLFSPHPPDLQLYASNLHFAHFIIGAMLIKLLAYFLALASKLQFDIVYFFHSGKKCLYGM